MKGYNKLLLIKLVLIGVITMLFGIIFISCGGDGNNSSSPTSLPTPTTYDCSADVYNCANFATQGDAQIVFNYCNSIGRGDIHRLDWNNNNIPCEKDDRQHETLSPTPTPQPTSAPQPTPIPTTPPSGNCQGCCSTHGGVVCRNGVTMCADGSALSATCRNKGCNMCL